MALTREQIRQISEAAMKDAQAGKHAFRKQEPRQAQPAEADDPLRHAKDVWELIQRTQRSKG